MADIQQEARKMEDTSDKLVAVPKLEESIEQATKKKSSRKSPSGKIKTKIHDRTEEYAYMTPNDLREVMDFGWFEYLLSQGGAFFFSGAFWLALEIISSQQKFQFTAYLGMCAISIVFGLILMIIGFGMFRIKQRKLKGYFPKG